MGLKEFLNKIAGRKERLSHSECLQMLNMVIDEEMDESEEFKSHLNVCMPCYEKYKLDKALKAMLKAKCCRAEVPDGLVEDIKSKISGNIIS